MKTIKIKKQKNFFDSVLLDGQKRLKLQEEDIICSGNYQIIREPIDFDPSKLAREKWGFNDKKSIKNMTANELRIGNLIKFDNLIGDKRIVTITGRFFTSFNNEDGMEINNFYQPIPITEEILLKCGFDVNPISKIVKSFQKTVKITMANSEILSLSKNSDKNGYWYLVFRQGDNTENHRMHINDLVFLRRDLQYLHQLQNFYFALTETELEITLAQINHLP
jgi:hypothetical protein